MPETEIDAEYIIKRLNHILEDQIYAYGFDSLLENSMLTEEEQEWVYAHLTYKVVEKKGTDNDIYKS